MTTQPHPEPSEEASSLTVVISTAPERIYLVIGEDCPPDARWDQLADVLWCEDNIDGNGVVYVREDLAQSQLNAMRVERDKWYQEAAAQAASAIAAHDALDALKAAPVVDVERIMALAEDLEAEAVYATRSGNLDRVRAAREALRASLASPEGSPK